MTQPARPRSPQRPQAGARDRTASPPVAEFATRLSDAMPEDLRPALLTPFFTRLPGTADEKAIEDARVALIAVETCRRVMPLMCIDVLDSPDLAALCGTAKDRADVRNICGRIRDAALAGAAAHVKSAYHMTKALRRAGEAANYAIISANEDCIPWVRDGMLCPAAAGHSIHMAWQSFRKFLEITFAARFPDEVDYDDIERRYAERYFTAATEVLDGAIRLGQ